MFLGRPSCWASIDNELCRHSASKIESPQASCVPRGHSVPWKSLLAQMLGGWASLRRPDASWASGAVVLTLRAEGIWFLSRHPNRSSNHFKSANCSIITKPWLAQPDPILKKKKKNNVDCFLRWNSSIWVPMKRSAVAKWNISKLVWNGNRRRVAFSNTEFP